MPPLLSKSKYLAGLQCSKLLWFSWNRREEIPAPDVQAQVIFDQGNEVGELARQLFPDGLEVEHAGISLARTLELTRQALRLRRPLFEAVLGFRGGYARGDILNPVGADAWDIIEVKSSTAVKPVNLHDLAFQHFVYTGAGLRIRRCFLLHVNSGYVRHGAIDPRSFFTQEDVTDQVGELAGAVETNALGNSFPAALRFALYTKASATALSQGLAREDHQSVSAPLRHKPATWPGTRELSPSSG